MIKTIYVIRKDLNMSGPKISVQVGHGTDFIHMRTLLDHTGEYGRKYDIWYARWIANDRRKSLVGIKGETQLKNLMKTLKDANIRFNEIWDKGYTELDGETLTGVVIHPIDSDEEPLPKAVTRLRLL